MHSFVIFAAVVASAAAGGVAVTGPAGIPTPNGWITGVADTPEVNAAKAQHFAAHAAARGVAVVGHHGVAVAAVRAVPLAGIPTAHGTITGVADTLEVQAAKAQHFAAHAAARGIHPVAVAAPVFHGAAIAHAPVVHHAAAHSVVHHGYAAAPLVHHAVAGPVVHHAAVGHVSGIPTPNGWITGVADTPEVSIAKANHFAAVREALARSG